MSNSSSCSFFELYCQGKALPEDIDDYVDRWHEEMKDACSPVPLHEYLGLSEAEYSAWVSDESCLPFILIARRNSQPLEIVMEERVDGLAARGADQTSLVALRNWVANRKKHR